MKYLALPFVCILFACSNKNAAIPPLPEAKATPIETLKEIYSFNIAEDGYKKIALKANFLFNHKDEVLKTMEVSEVDSIPGKDFVLVFYRYSVGTDIAHETKYMQKVNGNYFIYDSYFSDYSDDPFSNGHGEEGKALVKKADEWNGADKKIWWR